MSKVSDKNYLAKHQYSTPFNLRGRMQQFDFSVPCLSPSGEGLKLLNLNGNESILDVGCGAGNFLLLLKSQGHAGPLTGLDVSSSIFIKAAKKQKTIKFITGSGDSLPFGDVTFDCVTCFFAMYHIPNIGKAFMEFVRVLKPDGKLLLVTFSKDDKPKLKKIKEGIAKLIGKKPPEQFSWRFALEDAQNRIPKFFGSCQSYIHQVKLQIKSPGLYINTLNSIRDFFDPVPTDTEWQKALEFAGKTINDEIEKKGYFTDTIKIGLFLCRK